MSMLGEQSNSKDLSIAEIEAILIEKKHQLQLKRVFDIICSFISLIILAPLFIIIAVIIKTDSKGPAFFIQSRVTKDGKLFRIIKFRTMITDAEQKGMQITVGKDHRITLIGHALRKFKLDELPQLINVLKGDMSFVGPRPEVPKYVAMYTDGQRGILKIRSGITDLASIQFRNENDLLSKSSDPEKDYITRIMPTKIALNFEYIKKMSVLYDIKLIVNTLFMLAK